MGVACKYPWSKVRVHCLHSLNKQKDKIYLLCHFWFSTLSLTFFDLCYVCLCAYSRIEVDSSFTLSLRYTERWALSIEHSLNWSSHFMWFILKMTFQFLVVFHRLRTDAKWTLTFDSLSSASVSATLVIIVGRCLRHHRFSSIPLSFELCVNAHRSHRNFNTLCLLLIECRNMFKNNHPSMHQMLNETKQQRPICYYISFGLHSVFGGICISYLHLTRCCFHCIALPPSTVDILHFIRLQTSDICTQILKNPKMHIVFVIVFLLLFFMVIFHFENAMNRCLFHIKIFSSQNRFVYSSKCVWIVWLLNNNNQAHSTQNTVYIFLLFIIVLSLSIYIL